MSKDPGGPSSTPDAELEDLLGGVDQGDQAALERLLPKLYGELRSIARYHMARERPGHTLQPTALVNEAYLRLIGLHSISWKSKTHILSMASRNMRRILVEHERKRRAHKRGGDLTRVTLHDDMGAALGSGFDLLALDEALERLSQLSQRQAQVIELRFFVGLTVEEAATSLGVSPKTVKNDSRVAIAWIRRQLTD